MYIACVWSDSILYGFQRSVRLKASLLQIFIWRRILYMQHLRRMTASLSTRVARLSCICQTRFLSSTTPAQLASRNLTPTHSRHMATSGPVPIDAAPAVGQLVEHDGNVFETIREGLAFILVPPNTRTSVDPQAKAKAGEHLHINPLFAAHIIV